METQIYDEFSGQSLTIERFIAKIEKEDGPTVVLFGGIHGNEKAGVLALKDIFDKLSPEQIKGSVYAIAGNLKALSADKRFLKADLNRLWTHDALETLIHQTVLSDEQHEQHELFSILTYILNRNKPPYYFIDLHTTSSKTKPFITINDALINRKFSKLFPLPIVLGIEEYLEGPLLSYINTLGYVSLGFESGQHESPAALTNAISFVQQTLVITGLCRKHDFDDYDEGYERMKAETENMDEVYEVVYMHYLKNGDQFKMAKGFESFQSVEKGRLLARINGQYVYAPFEGEIFMPLYQRSGKEGFFLIRKIPPFFMNLSAVLRRLRINDLIAILPGVKWENRKRGILKVNLKVARFLTKPIFHLLGYRSRQVDSTHFLMHNREQVSKTRMYRRTKWF